MTPERQQLLESLLKEQRRDQARERKEEEARSAARGAERKAKAEARAAELRARLEAIGAADFVKIEVEGNAYNNGGRAWRVTAALNYQQWGSATFFDYQPTWVVALLEALVRGETFVPPEPPEKW